MSGEGIRGLEFWIELTDGRAANVSFVLDELIASRPELVDADRIAMVGHSAGGASATRAMVNDARIRAGADIDGTTSAPIPDTGLARPFLFLGKDSNYTPDSARSRIYTCVERSGPSWTDHPRVTPRSRSPTWTFAVVRSSTNVQWPVAPSRGEYLVMAQ